MAVWQFEILLQEVLDGTNGNVLEQILMVFLYSYAVIACSPNISRLRILSVRFEVFLGAQEPGFLDGTVPGGSFAAAFFRL